MYFVISALKRWRQSMQPIIVKNVVTWPTWPVHFNMKKVHISRGCLRNPLIKPSTWFNCNFALGLECATLPLVARHRYDDHLLRLTCSVEAPWEEYYWLICEKDRDPKNWFYYCTKCDFPTHLQCDDQFYFLFFIFIYIQNICININLLKYKRIFTVARRYVAKPTYGTHPIICTW